MGQRNMHLWIFCFALSSSVVAGVIAYYNPARRWQQLREETQSLASHVWQFRTRTGLFMIDPSGKDPRGPDSNLLNVVMQTKEDILTCADVGATGYQKVYASSVYKHGQYEPAAWTWGWTWGKVKGHEAAPTHSETAAGGKKHSTHGTAAAPPRIHKKKIQPSESDISTIERKENDKEKSNRLHREYTQKNVLASGKKGAVVAPKLDKQEEPSLAAKRQWMEDNHASPLTIEQYIELRVRTMITFYQLRLPSYSLKLTMSAYVLLIGTAVATLMAYLQLAHFVAIVTAVTSGVTSYMEFHSTDKKLMRYNCTIVGLQKALLWWNSLSDVERASQKNSNTLVCMCEDTIRNERGSWMATAQNFNEADDEERKEEAQEMQR